MATRIPKNARLSLTLNNGTNVNTGAMIKKTISFSNLAPGCSANALNAVATAIGGLLTKPVVTVLVVESDTLA